MKSPRTGEQFINNLDEHLSWRVQEIYAMRKGIKLSDGVYRNTLLRASVPLLYAHWEGFVKTVACDYCKFITSLGLPFSELKSSFYGIRTLSYVKQLHDIERRIFTASTLFEVLQGFGNEKANLPLKSHVANIGNLNFEFFEQIAEFLSIETAPYAMKKQLIDERLLKERNTIAHGEHLLVDSDAFMELSDEILALMRQFQTDISNATATKSYLRKEHQVA